MMAYADWHKAFSTLVIPGSPRDEARLWNLTHDNRINRHRGQFRRMIGRNFDEELRSGKPDKDSAEAALLSARETTEPVDSKWLGLLQADTQDDIPPDVVTFLASWQFTWANPGTPISADNPPRSITLQFPLKTDAGGPYTRFIWVTFDTAAGALPRDDPTRAMRELGMGHWKKGDTVYCFELVIESDQVGFTPTCLDAGLGEAWKPPPEDSTAPWGFTRDLTDGQDRWPELLVESADYNSKGPPAGRLVSPAGKKEKVGSVVPDFMIGR